MVVRKHLRFKVTMIINLLTIRYRQQIKLQGGFSQQTLYLNWGLSLASFPVVSSLSPGEEKQHRVRVRQTESNSSLPYVGPWARQFNSLRLSLSSVKWG